MKLESHCFRIIVASILLLLSLNGSHAGIWRIFKHLFKPISSLFKPKPVELPLDDGPTVPTVMVTPENTMFNLAPRLQSFFNPGDLQAKENFIISPMCAMVVLGQLLISVRGRVNDIILDILELDKERTKREATVIQESKDGLYDTQLYHGAFHYKLMGLVRKSLFNEGHDKAILSYALFHKKNAEFAESFRNNLNRVYRDLDFIPMDFGDMPSSIYAINQRGMKNNGTNLANHLTRLINHRTESFFLHTLAFQSSWKAHLKKSTGTEDFYLTPYEIVKTKYLKGIIQNTLYVDLIDFTLVRIPLSYASSNCYILLPKGDEYSSYDIRQFSESLHLSRFQEAINSDVTRDVQIKIPDVFSLLRSFDILKPLLMYIDYTMKEETDKFNLHTNLKLNGASLDLATNSLMQIVRLSISDDAFQLNVPADAQVQYPIVNNHDADGMDVVDFEVNRPFVFIIMNPTTKMVFVWGSVSHPEKLQ